MTTQTETTIESLAQEAYDSLEWVGENDSRGRRANICVLKDDAPEWVRDLMYDAHNDMLPDDRTFSLVQDALEAIADGADEDESHEFADAAVDVYTHDRLTWLASNLNRSSYVDQARDDGLIGPDTDTTDQIGVGQYVEALCVFSSVYRALESRLSDVEDEETDEGEDE